MIYREERVIQGRQRNAAPYRHGFAFVCVVEAFTGEGERAKERLRKTLTISVTKMDNKCAESRSSC
eukprot:scaffold12416_cov119-Skeletonema_menzelii.AAC.2